MNPIFDTLNDRQCEAVKHTEGPLLITAGAGSGKTKVLTCRIAHLLELGVAPYRILAITFTNKAAKEMKERVTNLVGAQADSIWLSTFHSFCTSCCALKSTASMAIRAISPSTIRRTSWSWSRTA